MNDLQIFNNAEFGSIRTTQIDNAIWFVGKDVAEALGYLKARNAISTHVDDEDKQDAPIQGTPGGTQKMTIINESGLYSLILSSKLESAKRFKHWVTAEVLPAIRSTGHYEAPSYAPKASSISEVVNLIKITKETMKEQGASSRDIATAVKSICDQFGVVLPNCFVKPKETTMRDVQDMIDFIFAQPKGAPPTTYEDFVAHQAMVSRRRLRG